VQTLLTTLWDSSEKTERLNRSFRLSRLIDVTEKLPHGYGDTIRSDSRDFEWKYQNHMIETGDRASSHTEQGASSTPMFNLWTYKWLYGVKWDTNFTN
jgi:hypothetical protein